MGLFFKPWHVYTSTYNVRARLFLNLLVLVKSQKQHTQLLELACCRASTTAQHSTAQHSAISHAQSSDARMYVPNRVRQRITCRTEYDNAGKQTELARASMASSIYLQLAVFSKPSKKSKSARPLPPPKGTSTSSWRCANKLPLFSSNLNRIQHSSFCFVHICMMHACGVRVVFLENEALDICKSSVCT